MKKKIYIKPTSALIALSGKSVMASTSNPDVDAKRHFIFDEETDVPEEENPWDKRYDLWEQVR